MIIDNIVMQRQSDCKDIMTFPAWQANPDYVYQYGCLLTAKLNCRNLFFKDTYMTLKELNNLMVKNNGYYYLYCMQIYDFDMGKVKKECFGKESFAIKNVLNNILKIKDEKEISIKEVDLSIPNEFFYVRTKFQDTGHYSMVVSKDLKYLDSYDGIIKEPKDILNLYKIIF